MSFGLRRRVIAVLVAVSCLAFATGEASAQEGWGTTPDQLSTPTSTDGAIYAPKVDVDAAGNAVALWGETGSTILGPGTVARTARYDAATRRWGAPVTLSAGERSVSVIDVAVDDAGNAIAIWRTNPISVTSILHIAEYRVSTGTWLERPTEGVLSLMGSVAMNGRGDAAVCWQAYVGDSYCRRYTAATSLWSEREVLSAHLATDTAIDATGSIQVLFEAPDAVSTQRFDAGTSTWGPLTPLATGLPGPGTPGARLATNSTGSAVATWARGPSIEAARYVPGSGWTAIETVVLGTDALFVYEAARPVVDAAGAITVAMVHTNYGRSSILRSVQTSRFTNGTWSTAAAIPGQLGFAYGPTAIDADAAGNVHVVWSQSLASPVIRLLASRFAVATGQWTTATNLSAVDQSAYNAAVALDGGGNAIAVWFQTASGFSVPQSLSWRGTLGAPAITSVTPAAGTLTIDATSAVAVSDPGLAASNFEYSLDGGSTWTPRAPASAASPITIGGLTDGVTYQLRLRSVNAAGAGVPTTTARVRSGIGTTPTDLRVVSRSGNIVTLAWKEPAAGLVPLEYVIEGGLDGQPAVLATLPTGGAATQVTLAVPDGAFFVRVAGSSGTLRLGTSPSLSIAVNTTSVPSTPQALLGSASGSTLALSWGNRWEGATPTAIQLSVSGALSASLALPVSESFSFAGVPSGTFTFEVGEQSGAVVSPFSAPVTLTFPGTCGGPPLPPSAFSASTQAGTVYLDWLPPSTGEAVASYLVSVTGAFTGSFPMATRTLAAPVPAGSYTIRVASVGLCGTSAPTAPQTVVVP